MSEAEVQSVLKTLSFFDVVGMPITFSAVRRWQWGNEVPAKPELVAMLDWHATLGQRADLREEQSLRLISDARAWLRVLCCWPGVQAMYLCNSVAFLSANEQSDVDVFVVTRPNQVWSTRFVLTALLALFGKRPKPGKEAGTICLSFFADANALDFSAVTLPAPKDIYLSYWAATLSPVFDPSDTEIKILQQNKALLPNERINTLRRIKEAHVEPIGILAFRLALMPFYGFVCLLQPLLKRWQKRRFPQAVTEAAKGDDHSVVISDTMLKFHTNDRREAYRLAWNKRYEVLQKSWNAKAA